MIPIAYAPNNDLYISADQGGFEIINVHPGNELYTELSVAYTWTGTGKSLFGIIVAEGPRVVGINSFYTWPEDDSVSHVEWQQGLKVIFDNKNIIAQIKLTDTNGAENTFEAVDGVIEITPYYTQDNLSRKLKATLEIDNTVISSVICLPVSESENFNLPGYIRSSGEYIERDSCYATDFVDVDFASDIAYQGRATLGYGVAVAAYDEDKNFVKGLLAKSYNATIRHITPDGTYKYIRAYTEDTDQYSLIVYFRNRG